MAPELFDDPEAFYEEYCRTPDRVELHSDQESVVARMQKLLPDVPIARVRERLAQDPDDSIVGMQEIALIISRKLEAGRALNRSEQLFYDCLRFGGVATGHPSLVSGNNAAGSDELRWCGYVVKRPSTVAELAVLLARPRAVRAAPTAQLLRDLRRRDEDRCAICGSGHDLQADHRQGIVKGGGATQLSLDAWQLLCRVCNCEKRSACNRCPNDTPDPSVRHRNCMTCLWGNREAHTHVALIPGRMVQVFLPVVVANEVERSS